MVEVLLQWHIALNELVAIVRPNRFDRALLPEAERIHGDLVADLESVGFEYAKNALVDLDVLRQERNGCPCRGWCRRGHAGWRHCGRRGWNACWRCRWPQSRSRSRCYWRN